METAPQFTGADGCDAAAMELAARGQGRVEPNPPVGAVVVDDALRLVSEGRHSQFGGPHAEVVALDAAGASAGRHAVRHAGAVCSPRKDAAVALRLLRQASARWWSRRLTRHRTQTDEAWST
ncbi:MAG: hypothetical protein U0992_00690 [Planctomycetaceae bacterium]